MPTNPYFNHENYKPSQDLLSDLNAEAIQSFGMDIWYLPRQSENYDWVFGTDKDKLFNKARKIEMFLHPDNNDAWSGDKEYLSNKFGMEIRDEVKLQVSKDRWKNEMESWNADLWKPRPGDIVSSILNPDSFWKIAFVNDEKSYDFYQLGTSLNWEISLELLNYNQENISTGIVGLDKTTDQFNIDEYDETTNVPEEADNDSFEDEKEDVLDFDAENPFGNY